MLYFSETMLLLQLLLTERVLSAFMHKLYTTSLTVNIQNGISTVF